MSIQKVREQRFLFVKTVYEISNGDSHAMLDMWEVGTKLGFDEDLTDRIVEYLRGEHLIKAAGLGGGISITHAGIVEVEAALSHPDRPTQHFPAINIITVQSMNNSVIQQGSTHSTVNAAISFGEIDSLKSFVTDLRSSIDKLNLSVDVQNELLSEIATLQAQAQSPKPKKSIIKEALLSIKSLMENVAANIIAAPITQALPALISSFS
jgi:hypothetical protein